MSRQDRNMIRRRGVRRAMTATPLVATAMVIGLIPSTGAAAEEQSVDTELDYTCEFPSEDRDITVGVTAQFPVDGAVDAAIEPADAELEVTIPDSGAAGLVESDADDPVVNGTAELDIEADLPKDSERVSWSELEIPETSVSEDDELTLEASGSMPSVTAAESGDASFSTGELTLELTPDDAEDPLDDPDQVTLSCEPESDQDTELASVPVSGDEDSDTDEDSDNSDAQPSDDDDEEDVPEWCYQIPDHINSMCAHMTGYSNVEQLNGAVMIETSDPGSLDYDLIEAETRPCEEDDLPEGNWECDSNVAIQPVVATLDLPEVESTLLTFEFMPVQATVELTMAEDYIDIDSETVSMRDPDTNETAYALTADIETTMSMRLSDVRVNDEPLDVGPDCRTAEPAPVEMRGESPDIVPDDPENYNVQFGGALRGFVDIPAFEGCGATEDLDPLLTGSISGEDNYIKMMQGAPCPEVGATPDACPPEVPEPRR